MSAHRRAAGVDDRAGARRHPLRRGTTRRPPRVMKHTSMLSGFAAVRSPRRAACARTSALVRSPTGKQRTGELALPEHVEDVRLVLGRVGPASQLERARRSPRVTRAWWPVATASNPSASARSSSRAELDRAVALHARIRACGRPVLVDVEIDDRVVEVVGEVEHVVGDAELRGDAPGVLDVGDAAAAGVGLAAPQLQGHTGDVVALLEQAARPRPTSRPRRSSRRARGSLHCSRRRTGADGAARRARG